MYFFFPSGLCNVASHSSLPLCLASKYSGGNLQNHYLRYNFIKPILGNSVHVLKEVWEEGKCSWGFKPGLHLITVLRWNRLPICKFGNAVFSGAELVCGFDSDDAKL